MNVKEFVILDLNNERYKFMNETEYKWVVTVDDSNCTVGVGGEGYLWQVKECPWYQHCYSLKGVGSPYNKSIFRDATPEEVENWLNHKQRASVPLKLYCGTYSPSF